MKLTVPAVRAAEPIARRQGVSEHTGELLDEIDALLAESLTTPRPHRNTPVNHPSGAGANVRPKDRARPGRAFSPTTA
jgi:hypothetical protein